MNDLSVIYRAYLTDHFYVKQEMLRNLIDNYENYSELWNKNGFYLGRELQKNDILQSLKIEMLGAMYQSIETLFTLIYVIDKYGAKGETHLWKLISIRNSKIVKWVDEIALGAFELKGDIEVGGRKVNRIRNLFYGNLPFLDEKELDKSVGVIEAGLVLLAKEFSDRDVYNAYKHGLRLFNSLSMASIVIGDERSIDIDGSNSITYLDSVVNIDSENKFIIKNVDVDFCYNASIFVAALISNLIRSRKAELMKVTENIVFFGPDLLKNLQKSIAWDNMVFQISNEA
jgi:hypothetical protein